MKTDLDKLVRKLKRLAWSGIWNGKMPSPYLERCRVLDRDHGVSALFTRDTGHHTSGWWKNPDYERCLHLSLSFFDIEALEYVPKQQALTDRIVAAVFGVHKRWLWCEPPYSPEGKKKDVWHYRLFCDKGWQPIKPRGEVYNKELTEAGWLSYSDLQAVLETQRAGGVLLPVPPERNRP